MKLQPLLPQLREADRLEGKSGRDTSLKFRVDLRSQLPGGVSVRTDPGAMSLPLIRIAEVPDAATEISTDTTDTE